MNEEEIMLNGLLIDKCKEEGIMIALVAINRETKEIELPQSFKDMVNDPNYYICYCHRSEKEEYIIEKIKEIPDYKPDKNELYKAILITGFNTKRKPFLIVLKQLYYIDISEDTTINLLTDQSGISSLFIFAAA